MPTLFAGNRLVGIPKSSMERKELKEEAEEATATLPKIITIHNARKLLEKEKHQALIKQCTQLLDFTPEQQETYLIPLIESFAEFVQNLPETRNSYFSKPGGFIDHALMRTASSLSMCRAYFSNHDSEHKNTRLTNAEVLWMYTLFAASIFNGIGKIFSDLIVDLYDDTGKLLDRWSPFEKSMLETKAYFYDYDFEEARQIDLFSRRLSVLLAKQLIPFRGFAWISSDKEVLSVWLALLEDNQRDAGTLGPFLVRADALAINTYFDEKRLQKQYMLLDTIAKEETDHIAKEKEEADLKQLDEKEKAFFKASLSTHEGERKLSEKRNTNTHTQAGIEFLKWLTNELKAQRIEINKAIYYLPEGAVFLPTAMFEEFRKKHPYYTSTQDVITSFNKLQLQTKGATLNDLHTFIKQEMNTTTQKIESTRLEGIIINNPQIVLPTKVIVRSVDNTRQELNSSELAKNPHLLAPLQLIANTEKLSATSTETNSHVNNDSSLKNFFMFGR